jgi:hypothetical protein
VYLRWLCGALAAGEADPARRFEQLALDFEPHRIALESRGPGSLREAQPIRVRRLATQSCGADR